MEQKTEIAFMGDIQPATCECHKGQFVALIYMCQAGQPPEHLASIPFITKEGAAAEMDRLILATAKEVMKLMGIPSEKISHIKSGNNAEALKIYREFKARHDPNIH